MTTLSMSLPQDSPPEEPTSSATDAGKNGYGERDQTASPAKKRGEPTKPRVRRCGTIKNPKSRTHHSAICPGAY